MALSALRANKVRSALTLLGILVGVFSIIAVMTAIRVMQDHADSSLSQLGANTFQIQKWASITVGGRGERDWQKYYRRKDLTYEHAQALAERLTLAKHIGVDEGLDSTEVLSDYEKTNPDVQLRGVTPGSFPGKNWKIAQGRALLDTDLDNNRRVLRSWGAGRQKSLSFRFRSRPVREISRHKLPRRRRVGRDGGFFRPRGRQLCIDPFDDWTQPLWMEVAKSGRRRPSPQPRIL